MSYSDEQYEEAIAILDHATSRTRDGHLSSAQKAELLSQSMASLTDWSDAMQIVADIEEANRGDELQEEPYAGHCGVCEEPLLPDRGHICKEG